ncbi:MAG: CC0125/CC1285 family lipoprotein [Asticcacaulis sp.]
MNNFTRAAAALMAAGALAALAGCVTPTPYQPSMGPVADTAHPGYSDTRLEDNRFRIVFAGNDATPRDTVETYLLYHAADLTLQNGYDWFEVVKRTSDQKSRQLTTYSDPFFGGVSWRFYRRGWSMWGGMDEFDADTREITRYEASAEVLMHHGAKPDAANAYDARQIKANLEPKIVRPTAK